MTQENQNVSERVNVKSKSKNLFQIACILVSTLVPFIVVTGFWLILDFANTSQGVERERDIGIQHTITDKEMFFKALGVGMKQGGISALVGFVVGSVCVFIYNRKQKSV